MKFCADGGAKRVHAFDRDQAAGVRHDAEDLELLKIDDVTLERGGDNAHAAAGQQHGRAEIADHPRRIRTLMGEQPIMQHQHREIVLDRPAAMLGRGMAAQRQAQRDPHSGGACRNVREMLMRRPRSLI